MQNSIKPKLQEAIKNLNYKNDSFYIFDKDLCIEEINYFKNSFNNYPSFFSYSYKTNYCLPLIKLIDKNDFYSEVVSPFEVDLTRLYGIDPSKIIYNGPVKDFESIKYVFKGGGIINADSLSELKSFVSNFSFCVWLMFC